MTNSFDYDRLLGRVEAVHKAIHADAQRAQMTQRALQGLPPYWIGREAADRLLHSASVRRRQSLEVLLRLAREKALSQSSPPPASPHLVPDADASRLDVSFGARDGRHGLLVRHDFERLLPALEFI